MSANQLAVIGGKEVVTEKDLEILKNSKFRGFDEQEIAYCAKVSNQLQFSPFLNQIHFVKRKNKDGSSSIAAQVGIDGFRLAAQRTGEYAGSDDVVFEYAADKKKPIKATVTVYKQMGGQRCPFTASARWEEFYNPIGGMWDRLPHQMLGKCAEAQALRKAFPAELSGIHTPEEMDQADKPDKAATVMGVIKPEPKTVDSSVSAPPPSVEGDGIPPCSHCRSANVMWSRFHENSIYCKDCKKTTAS